MTDKAPEPLDLIAQLNGRIAFCRNRGEVKTPTLLTQAATALEAAQARIAELQAERDEARRRRDEWRKKAEGYDAVRLALREKVGAPWPPNLSRAMWAGIAADEKKRADDAEDAASTARAEALEEAAKAADDFSWVLPFYGKPDVDEATDDCAEAVCEQLAAAIRALKGETHGD